MNNIISQDFWCATLTKENPECKWQQLDEEVTHHLMIEQAVLGLNSKERCMIEATARTADGTEKSCMICHLIPSSVPNCQLTLSFKQVSLRLAAGDGPVYLTGTHSQEVEGADEFSDEEGEDAPALINAEAEEGEEEEEEESSDEEEIDEDKMLEELAAAQANKLKTFMKKDKKGKLAPPGPQSKKVEPSVEAPKPAAKKVEEKKEEVVVKQDVEMEAAEEEDSSEEEDDEEEDDDEENAEGKVEEKAAVEEEDDDDDDDDDNEVDSDDDDEEEEDDEDDDEESEEESDEEEEPAPVTKKRKTEAATPVPVKANGKPAATPKQSKKPQTPVAKPNLNELKKKLMASPSLPKKYEKFVNLMKNAHKVTDDKEIKSTWEFVQKNKK